MSLKYSVDTLDGVPEAMQSFYTQSDGKYVLQVDGAVPKSRLDEFRDNNTKLKGDIEALSKQYEGVDLEAYRTLTERAQKERDKKLIDAGKVDELVTQRVDAMKSDYEKRVDALTKEGTGYKLQLESLLVDGALRDAAIKAGVKPTAVDDVLLRGRQTFRVVDGKAAAFQGDKALFGKDSEPLAVGEWVTALQEAAPHLFEASTGGGAPAGGSQGKGGQATIKRAAWNALAPAEKSAAARTMKIVD